jgi:chromosomal replication initiation ATPase DnaA
LQLSFPFQSSAESDLFKEEDFLLLTENSATFNFCKKFFAQKDFSASQFQSLIIKGAKASGKTHLLNIFAKKTGSEFLDKDKILGVNPANFFTTNRFYILENFEEIEEQELLLSLINSAVEAQAFLVLSAQEIPQFKLKDLASRLKNIHATEIKKPSHESLKLLLANQLSRRQIKISRVALNFISDNIERSFAALFDVLKFLEDVSSSSKSLELARVKQFLKDAPRQS